MQPDFPRDARIASILTRIAQLPKKPRLLVTIDGPCGSGKSTLADALSAALNAPIISSCGLTRRFNKSGYCSASVQSG